MKVHYEFSRDGRTGARNFSDLEVSEELGAVLAELDREEYNLNRKPPVERVACSPIVFLLLYYYNVIKFSRCVKGI